MANDAEYFSILHFRGCNPLVCSFVSSSKHFLRSLRLVLDGTSLDLYTGINLISGHEQYNAADFFFVLFSVHNFSHFL